MAQANISIEYRPQIDYVCGVGKIGRGLGRQRTCVRHFGTCVTFAPPGVILGKANRTHCIYPRGSRVGCRASYISALAQAGHGL